MYAWAAGLWEFANPALLVPLALLVGVGLWWSPWERFGKCLATLGAIGLFVISSLPLAGWLTATLENRFPQPETLPSAIDGIILLGGSVDLSSSKFRDYPIVNHNANRFLRFADLAKKHPQARLVFTGAGRPVGKSSGLSETEVSVSVLEIIGVDLERLEIEDRSTNTYDNAVLTYGLVKPVRGEVWLLVTSAWHMPRAMGSFRQAGWEVIPVSAGRTSVGSGWSLTFSPGPRLVTLSRAVHEWIGLLVYRLLGRSGELFPSP